VNPLTGSGKERSVSLAEAEIFEDYISGEQGNLTKSNFRNMIFEHFFNKSLISKIIHTLLLTFVSGICFKITFL
jgi:hypothetical protein